MSLINMMDSAAIALMNARALAMSGLGTAGGEGGAAAGDAAAGNEAKSLSRRYVYLVKLAHVILGDKHLANSVGVSRHSLLLESSDSEDLAAKRDLAGHGYVALYGSSRERADEGCNHSYACRRAVLWYSSLGNVNVYILCFIEIGGNGMRLCY